MRSGRATFSFAGFQYIAYWVLNLRVECSPVALVQWCCGFVVLFVLFLLAIDLLVYPDGNGNLVRDYQ